MNYKIYKNSSKKGFTLIEMIVSLAIFTIVALVAIGAFLRVLDANKKSINLKTTINNLNFALESLSREMRVGKDYYYTFNQNNLPGTINAQNFGSNIGDSQLSGENDHWMIAFRSSKTSNFHSNGGNVTCNLIYAYRYDKDNDKIQKAQQKNNDCDWNISSDDFADLTATDIKITKSRVRIDTTAGEQPYAFFYIEGESKGRDSEKVNFSMQTRVSQRVK